LLVKILKITANFKCDSFKVLDFLDQNVWCFPKSGGGRPPYPLFRTAVMEPVEH